MIALPPHPRILVVALRRLGDVLLTTPLIRSLKQAFPDAAIEALVFAGTEGILAGNPDLAGVVTMPPRAAAGSLALVRSLWRQYDLAISTQSGDRPIFFAWVAGRASAGPVAPKGGMAALKRMALDYPVVADLAQHRVEEVLQLARALGIPAVRELVCPSGPRRADLLPYGDYAVIHAGPMFRYKRWTAEGWRALAAALAERGLAVVATGGPGPEDQRYSDEVWVLRGTCDAPVVRRLDGVLTWPELAGVISGRQGLYRAGYLGHAPRGRHRRDDGGALWANGAASALDHGRPGSSAAPGRRPARSSAGATYGWCKIRCRAFRARMRAASVESTVTAAASTGLSLPQVLTAVDQALASVP